LPQALKSDRDLREDAVVIRRRDAVLELVEDDAGRQRLAADLGIRTSHEDVVDAAWIFVRRRGERVSPGIEGEARPAADLLVHVGQVEALALEGVQSLEEADLARFGLRVEVTDQDGGQAVERGLAFDVLRDRHDLPLADDAMMELPVEMGHEE